MRYVIGLLLCLFAVPASATDVVCNNDGRCIVTAGGERMATSRVGKRKRGIVREHSSFGGSTVSSRSGVSVHVNPSARAALQCVVDYIERAGIRITAMRGYGAGTVAASLHPSGNALDINQYARGRTRPHIPVHTANAAGNACGVVSGGTWRNNDAGHWNLGTYAHRHKKRVRYAKR